ncbi:hypothetical protein CEUSTIGMA_g3788.t1 [Chlamydomonas eustigma]|uniref:Intron-binding protein aquarius n=1 Tax=Chlamydomonas eustigma TaxID=1157962 RepID=A0A250X0C0_9CHLO|nr:hypothetical protein CEUSTIGMA_g3788.t1 [Chlamydomonas eustigma]|eukprot:GAX76342.1 hypothetical protein CEUSTIGMA_g3788.t1 [Chlamydomonas eustigma]
MVSDSNVPRISSRKARPNSVDDVVLAHEIEGADQKSLRAGKRHKGMMLTVAEIATDKLTKVAHENWSASTRSQSSSKSFSPDLVKSIYMEELGGAADRPPSLKRIMLLEISQYLESYLWPNLPDTSTGAEPASFEHIMSILIMVNEKFRENVPPWTCFHARKEAFPDFFKQVLSIKDGVRELKVHERTAYLVFAINIFQSLEDEMVRGQVLRLVSLPLWQALSQGRLQLELHAHPQLAKHWKALLKKEQKAAAKPGYVPPSQRMEVQFIPSLLTDFIEMLDKAIKVSASMDVDAEEAQEEEGPFLDRGALLYCERSLELLVDLLSQLPTRRFVHTLLEDRAVLVKCKLSSLYRFPGKGADLYRQLVDLFQFYMGFAIDNHTGDPQADDDITTQHYEKVCQLQRLAFKHWPQLKELALSNCGSVEKRDTLKRYLSALSEDELRFLTTRQLRLVSEQDPWAQQKEFLQEVMLSTYERRRFQREVINEMPLYPTEGVLWDDNQIPSVNYSGETCLALPKLNLQFLTAHDYLLRNFNLFRLEATYEIREDIADVLGRVGAYLDDNDRVRFAGWARMALPMTSFKITEVRKPNVGENKPAAVTAEVLVDTKPLRGPVRGEWDQVKQHDVLFLLTIRPPSGAEVAAMMEEEGPEGPGVRDKYGLVSVRGCEVIEVRDEAGKLMNDFTGRVKPDERTYPDGFSRTLVVALDTAQYQLDMNYMAKTKSEDVYSTFNLIMRRKPKENNFKAVLESIRDLMNEEVIIPGWLHDIFLGYGDPGAAHYSSMDAELRLNTVDCKDTFLDADHVVQSFPQYEVQFQGSTPEGAPPAPPFRITFPSSGPKPLPAALSAHSRADGSSVAVQLPAPMDDSAAKEVLTVESYTPPDPGPYPQNQPRRNQVRFTPVQVEAITAGVQPGLTMVVGPPGTGKTDTAVQIMNVLYHNCPGQRTLLITHSNQALNDLFQKIMERDIPSRYLLRLGMGEQELDSDEDYSRAGRVNAMLARRLQLLAEVEKLARCFGVTEDVAYTCETAAHFWLLHILSRWERFSSLVEKQCTSEAVTTAFPFKEYFADAPQPLFSGHSYEADMERARGCFRHLKTLFQELEEIRPFELLRGQGDRVNYLMSKQAKIVAMTCTHAALKRREFVELAFKYDNLLMEEAAQILEIETFIPMLLQRQEDGVSRLKRVVLIGDHHQLPPVVKNMAFQKYSHLDQSLFARFIRLGTPYVELNAQGRARPSMANLYNWRYRALGDLPYVHQAPEYLVGNAGLAFEYQFINVEDFMGRGESEPTPYFYQNLGEAEYVTSLYCFMRLLGYPAHKITILTTYNGQKHLIRDVIERRCAGNPILGRPHKVTTVDKYQGQQNDYVLLSLVRSRIVGHLRDVRRLVVAMSRARLGLYVFGRQELFSNCYELQPTFKQLLSRPTQLALVKGESYGTCTRRALPVSSSATPLIGGPMGANPTIMLDLINGPEEMADLVGRFMHEKLLDAELASAAIPAGAAAGTADVGSGSAAHHQQEEPGISLTATVEPTDQVMSSEQQRQSAGEASAEELLHNGGAPETTATATPAIPANETNDGGGSA